MTKRHIKCRFCSLYVFFWLWDSPGEVTFFLGIRGGYRASYGNASGGKEAISR